MVLNVSQFLWFKEFFSGFEKNVSSQNNPKRVETQNKKMLFFSMVFHDSKDLIFIFRDKSDP